MSVYQELRSVCPNLSTEELLRFLIAERFSGKTVVTASLKASSVVVLKMVADIDSATPVVFCRRGFEFPESVVYRERIVGLLGLQNVSQTEGGEVEVLPSDYDHCESMWAESRDGLARSFEIVHLNQTLAPYDCWISAVYHVPRPPHLTQRVDVESRLIRVDPLIRWNKDEVRSFMRKHNLPFHPRAARRAPEPPGEVEELPPTYHY